MSTKTKSTKSKKTTKATKKKYEQEELGEIKVRKAKDAKNKRRTHLFYGKNGTGKTTLAASYPKPALLIDVKDEGDESVEDVEGLDIFEVTEWNDIEKLYWWLKKNPKRYKTIILDTLTQLQPLCVEHVMKTTKSKLSAKSKKAGAWGSMNQKQWGIVADDLRTAITRFHGLDSHFVILAQEKMTEIDDLQDAIEDVILPEVGPAIMKSVATHACSISSVIGNTFIRNKKSKKELRKTQEPTYCLRVGPSPVYLTKVRKPASIKLPSHISNPTFDRLTKLKQGSTNGKEEGKERW